MQAVRASQKISDRMPITTSRPMMKMTPMVPPMNLSIPDLLAVSKHNRAGARMFPGSRAPGKKTRAAAS